MFESGGPNGPDSQPEQSNKRARDDWEEEYLNFSSEANANANEWMPPLHTTELMGEWPPAVRLQENDEIFGELPSFSLEDYMSTMVGEGIGVPSGKWLLFLLLYRRVNRIYRSSRHRSWG